ncbi:bifunctional 5,10-methylenetetrahydrofolate dehydrogenase/5,10-methenyltetrahydrofolate cyclohydrolase [Lacunimicrobium album]
MTARVLNGNTLAKKLREELQAEVANLTATTGVKPCLAAILVGSNPASEVYVRNKRSDCEKVGMTSQLHVLEETITQDELLQLIDRLNSDPLVHGILCQLPLPKHIEEQTILDAITPLKDVDAFHPENVGLLVQGRPRFLPCTPAGCHLILKDAGIETAGKHVVVLGRSEIVGKPMANIMLQKAPAGGDATVTVCHSRTQNLAEIIKQADILIAAIGKPKFVTADMVKDGVVVIDVGINRIETGLVGDVDYESVAPKSIAITPVPGGVGPMTRAVLLKNTLKAAQLAAGN